MKTSTLDRIAVLSRRSVCVLALATASCCFVSAPRAMLSAESLVGVGSAPPGGLAEINTECWDAASLALIEAKKMRADDGVAALWDLMTRLSASPQPRHQELFMKLAQAFWERYVDCVMSRAHGLGRRRSGVSAADRQLSF
ncbi:protein FAM237B-like [Pangasianodon hypophthalmus]|uniref:protein FAM237B-like n=1 Tax=Pangasianodon hypophthalmus TaxID=310915 RepID=UPI000EFE602A|nr:protein FAM237B-like [Pangasianodon hypophthalmus]